MSNGKTYPPAPPNILQIVQMFLDNDLPDQALAQIEKYNLQIDIQDGKIIDKQNSTEFWLRKFITVDNETTAMKDDVRKLSKVEDEVLICGPSGSGKELIAHALLGNREGAVMPVNCAGLPDTLIDSMLFGAKRGSYTGADTDKAGLCVAARDGILFLDEIGELPIALQPKLLRAIQEKKILPLGETKEKDISCRFIFATHRDLRAMVMNGEFRVDLYARISTFEIHIKGLRDRPCDILPIIDSLPDGKETIKHLESKYGKAILDHLDTSLGVRSLQQLVRRFKVLQS